MKVGTKALGKTLGKGAAKTVAKGAAKTAAKKTAAKGAKTATGKLVGKLAPQVVKAGRRISASALKQLRKTSPGFAKFVKNGRQALVKACSKSGLSTEIALQTIGDFFQQSMEKANEEDKKVIEVMKEELKSEKTTEEIKNKLEAMFAVIVDLEDDEGQAGGEEEEQGGEEQ